MPLHQPSVSLVVSPTHSGKEPHASLGNCPSVVARIERGKRSGAAHTVLGFLSGGPTPQRMLLRKEGGIVPTVNHARKGVVAGLRSRPIAKEAPPPRDANGPSKQTAILFLSLFSCSEYRRII